MYKKGYTLVEVVVAMGIFLTVMTLAVGAFVVISRMRALTTNMRDSQQKLRIASEKIVRLSRSANKVTITTGTGYKQLELRFAKSGGGGYMAKYRIEQIGATASANLIERECVWGIGDDEATVCPAATYGNPVDVLGGSVDLTYASSSFAKNYNGTNVRLVVNLVGKINGLAPYYEDNFTVNPEVLLEGLR